MNEHFVFTALHGSSDENSVRLSVKRVISDKIEERSVQICIPYQRQFSVVFGEEEWLVGAIPSTGPRWSEIVDFEPIFARERLSRNT